MKTAAILLSLVAAAGINAQGGGLLAGQPACATSCISSAITAAGCALPDIPCQCGPTKTLIASSAIPCLVTACVDVSDVVNAQRLACLEFVAVSTTTTPPPSPFTTSAATTTSPFTPSAATTTSSTSLGGGSEGNSSLSSGASIGVGVGIALGVVAIVGGAWVVCKRRRRTRRGGGRGAAGQLDTTTWYQLDDGKDGSGGAGYRPELEANQVPVEIGGGHDRRTVLAELDGGVHRWSRRG